MANSIKIKRSAVAAKVPLTTDLALGELAINTYDGKLYLKKDNGTESIVTVNAGGGGSGDVVGPGSSTDNAITRFDGVTGLLIQNSTATLDDSGVVSVSAANISGLTASSAVATDVSKNLVSVANTGTGSNVLATSPTLITPALGTPTALVGTNISGTASGLSIGGNAATVTNGVYTTDTSTVTNLMLAGSIANAKLVNSAITINGTPTSLGGSISVGTVTSVTGTSPISSSGGAAPDISISAAGTTTSGYLSATDWNTFNNKGSGAGSVTSVSGTGTVSGISLSGTVTTTGSLTLGGSLNLSSPPTIGNTAANTGAFTTLSASGHTIFEGVTSTGATGTGKLVYDGSPALVTPNLGTPTALVGTNISGTASGLTAGTVTTNANLTGGVTSVGNAATVVTNANLTGGVTSVGNAATVITNANLTGPITSVGNATSIASQTGTGSTFVVATSPVLVTPNLGTPSAAVLTNATGTATGLTAGTATTANGVAAGVVAGKMIYDQFTATALQTTFTTSATYISGKIDVYANGVKMVNAADVTVTSGTSVVFTTGVALNTRVDLVYPT